MIFTPICIYDILSIIHIGRIHIHHTAAQQWRYYHSTNTLLVFLFIPGTSRSGGERRRAPCSRAFSL